MITKEKNRETTRFEARIPKEQKQLFKKAVRLGGYSNLSDFILKTAREKAVKIIAESEQILSSKKDSELFFDAITNPPKPSKELTKAVKEYNAFFSK
ncbi:DUF1778 domain-containing protein [bacterium]|nr:MAG: DUF1778 domain-containing protein [bacterium]